MGIVLHVFNGDCAAEAWKKVAHASDRYLVWRENYLEGPLPAAETPREEFARIRAEFLHTCVPEYPVAVLTGFQCRLEEELAQLRAEDAVMLWFDDCMFDVWILSRILFLLENSPAKLHLCCENRVLGNEKDLFLTPYWEFPEVTPEQKALYAGLWRAVTAGTAALKQFTGSGCAQADSAMKRALTRYLSDHPENGALGQSERKLIDLIAGGVHEFRPLFRAFNAAEERPFMGDTMCERLLKKLAQRGLVEERRPDVWWLPGQ